MLYYVNKIRARKNLTMLENGAEMHLQNGIMHSKAMKEHGTIFHQTVQNVKLGCGSFFSGENIAKNHCLLGRKSGDGKVSPTDPARMCVKQFYNSEPHRRNLENPTHQTAIMGVFVSADGYVWCTQTFARSTTFTETGVCRSVDGVMDANSTVVSLLPTPSPSPSIVPRSALDNVSSTGHKFATLEFWGRLANGKTELFKLQCSRRECRFCNQEGGDCLPEQQSIGIDERISS